MPLRSKRNVAHRKCASRSGARPVFPNFRSLEGGGEGAWRSLIVALQSAVGPLRFADSRLSLCQPTFLPACPIFPAPCRPLCLPPDRLGHLHGVLRWLRCCQLSPQTQVPGLPSNTTMRSNPWQNPPIKTSACFPTSTTMAEDRCRGATSNRSDLESEAPSCAVSSEWGEALQRRHRRQAQKNGESRQGDDGDKTSRGASEGGCGLCAATAARSRPARTPWFPSANFGYLGHSLANPDP